MYRRGAIEAAASTVAACAHSFHHTFTCDLPSLLNAAAVNAAANNAAAVNAADVNTAANTGTAPRPRPVRAPTLTLRCLSPQQGTAVAVVHGPPDDDGLVAL